MNDLTEHCNKVQNFLDYCQGILDVVDDKSLRAGIKSVMSSVSYCSPETAAFHQRRLVVLVNSFVSGKTKETVTEEDIKILAAFTLKPVEEIIAGFNKKR